MLHSSALTILPDISNNRFTSEDTDCPFVLRSIIKAMYTQLCYVPSYVGVAFHAVHIIWVLTVGGWSV